MEPDHLTVAARVCHQQDQSLRAQIPVFRSCLALHQLEVDNCRLRLDEGVPVDSRDHGVATATVARGRHRDFGSPTKARPEPSAEPAEEGEVGAIAHRVAVEAEVRGELQTDGGGHAGENVDRLRSLIASFDSRDPVGAHSQPSSNLTPADARGNPCGQKLLRQSVSKLSAAPLAEGRRREAVGHRSAHYRAEGSPRGYSDDASMRHTTKEPWEAACRRWPPVSSDAHRTNGASIGGRCFPRTAAVGPDGVPLRHLRD